MCKNLKKRQTYGYLASINILECLTVVYSYICMNQNTTSSFVSNVVDRFAWRSAINFFFSSFFIFVCLFIWPYNTGLLNISAVV